MCFDENFRVSRSEEVEKTSIDLFKVKLREIIGKLDEDDDQAFIDRAGEG